MTNLKNEKTAFYCFRINDGCGNKLVTRCKKALKNASKDLAKYYQDPINNMGKLDEALVAMSGAFQDEMVKTDPESWIIRGEIYNSIGNAETNQLILNPAYKVKTPMPEWRLLLLFKRRWS